MASSPSDDSEATTEQQGNTCKLSTEGESALSTTVAALYSVGDTGSSGERLWKLGRLNHVAIAVPDLSKATKLYKDIMGAKCSGIVNLPEHGVSTVFVELGNCKLELLAPLGKDSPIQGYLDKKPGGGMHHVCIEVKNINKAVSYMADRGVRAIDPKPKIGAHGKPVVFLHPKDCGGVLLEIEEE